MRTIAGVLGIALVAVPVAGASAQTAPEGVSPGELLRQFDEQPEPRVDTLPPRPEAPEQAVPEGTEAIRFELAAVELEGVTVYEDGELAEAWADLIGTEVGFGDLVGVANGLTARYRRDGYILSQVVVPAQEVEDGVVRLRAVEGYVDRVVFEGQIEGPRRHLDPLAAAIEAERPLTVATLERNLLLIGDLPGVNVQSVLEPSPDQFGAADLTIVLAHDNAEGFVQLDNHGSEFTGPLTAAAGASFYSIFGGWEQIDLTVAFNPEDPEELVYGSGRVTIPIGPGDWGTRLELEGSVLTSDPSLPDDVFGFEQPGRGFESAIRVVQPIIRSRDQNLTARAGFRLSEETTDIDEFDLKTQDRARVVEGGLTYDVVDPLLGVNLVDVSMHQGLDIFTASRPSEVSRQGAGASAEFTYVRGTISRLQPVGGGVSFFGSLEWQYAFDPLLPSERFSVGGRRIGRGFPPGSVVGDHGLAAKAEVRYGNVVDRQFLESYQAYGFFDFGKAWDVDSTTDDENDLASVGLGVRWNVTSDVAVNPEIAHRIDGSGPDDSIDDSDTRLLFTVTARF